MPYKCWLTLSQGIFTFLKHVIDERRDYHVAIATVIFSLVKISCFRAKAHPVFHWCLYNNFSCTVQSIQSQGKHFVNFNQLSCTELIIKLMNSQTFSLNSHLLKFISLCNDLRNNLLSNHIDDTNDSIDHCYHIVLFVLFFFF